MKQNCNQYRNEKFKGLTEDDQKSDIRFYAFFAMPLGFLALIGTYAYLEHTRYYDASEAHIAVVFTIVMYLFALGCIMRVIYIKKQSAKWILAHCRIQIKEILCTWYPELQKFKSFRLSIHLEKLEFSDGKFQLTNEATRNHDDIEIAQHLSKLIEEANDVSCPASSAIVADLCLILRLNRIISRYEIHPIQRRLNNQDDFDEVIPEDKNGYLH